MCFTFSHPGLNDATGGLCGECSGQLFPSPSAKTGPAQSKRDSQEPQQALGARNKHFDAGHKGGADLKGLGESR